MTKRKILKTVLAAGTIAALLLTGGCAKGGDYGGISEPDEDSPETEVIGPEEEYVPFNMTDTALDYEFDYLKIGRAFVALPYPKGWDVKRQGNSKITFTAPADDKYFPGMKVFFHSELEIHNTRDTSVLDDLFLKNMLRDKFTWKGKSYTLATMAEQGQPTINTDISDPDAQMQIAYHIKDVTLKRGSSFVDEGMYMQQQYFYWYDIPCVLAAVTTNDKEKELDDLLEYMFSNCFYIQDIIANTQQQKTGSITIPVCPVYKPAAADTGDYFDDAYQFICPVDNETGFAQSGLAVYEISKDRWIGISEESLESTLVRIALNNTFGKETMNSMDIAGGLEGVGKFDFNGKKVKEYLYSFNICNMKKDHHENFFNAQMWYAAFYPVRNGDVVDLIVLVTPKSGLTCTLDCIIEIAEKIQYN